MSLLLQHPLYFLKHFSNISDSSRFPFSTFISTIPSIPSNALFKYNVHRYRLSDSPPAKRIYDRHARGERPDKIHKRFNVNYRRWPSWKSGFYYIYGKHAIFLKLGSARNFLPSCRILVSHLRFRPALERSRDVRPGPSMVTGCDVQAFLKNWQKSRGNEGRQVKERGQ